MVWRRPDNARILLIGPLGTNFREILIRIQTLSFEKMHLKMAGFPQTRLEKFQWFFNDISRQKYQISMTIIHVTKQKKHRTTCYTWSPHTSYDHYGVLIRKSVKSSYIPKEEFVKQHYMVVCDFAHTALWRNANCHPAPEPGSSGTQLLLACSSWPSR